MTGQTRTFTCDGCIMWTGHFLYKRKLLVVQGNPAGRDIRRQVARQELVDGSMVAGVDDDWHGRGGGALVGLRTPPAPRARAGPRPGLAAPTVRDVVLHRSAAFPGHAAPAGELPAALIAVLTVRSCPRRRLDQLAKPMSFSRGRSDVDIRTHA